MIQLLWEHEVSAWIMVDVTRVNDSLRTVILAGAREPRSSVHGTVPNKTRRWLIDFVPLRPRSKIYALFTVAGIVHIYDIHPSYFHETRERKIRLRIVIYLEVINLGALRMQSGYTLNQYPSIYIEGIVNVATKSLFFYSNIYNKY